MMLRYFALAMLIALVIGSGYLLRSEPQDQQRESQRDLSEGYYLLDATISDTNDTGQLIYSLNAARMDHVPDDGSVKLTELKVLYAGTNNDTWTIEAQHGTMGAAREQLNLRGNVIIASRDENTDQNTTINTEQLVLDITNNQARTSEEVRIEISGGQLNALGMEADLKAKTINLLTSVRGSFGDSQ